MLNTWIFACSIKQLVCNFDTAEKIFELQNPQPFFGGEEYSHTPDIKLANNWVRQHALTPNHYAFVSRYPVGRSLGQGSYVYYPYNFPDTLDETVPGLVAIANKGVCLGKNGLVYKNSKN